MQQDLAGYETVNQAYNDSTAVMTHADSRDQMTGAPSHSISAEPSTDQHALIIRQASPSIDSAEVRPEVREHIEHVQSLRPTVKSTAAQRGGSLQQHFTD